MKTKFKGVDHKGGGGGGVLPEGDYIFEIESDKWEKTAAGDGHKLTIQFTGACKASGKRKVWDTINLDNPSEQAVEIAEKTLEKIVFCVLGDEGELKFKKDPTLKQIWGSKIGVHLTIEEPTKKEKKKHNWKDKNRISFYFPADEHEPGKKKKSKEGKKKKNEDVPF